MTADDLKGEMAIIEFAGMGDGIVLPFDDAVAVMKAFSRSLRFVSRWEENRQKPISGDYTITH